MKYLLSATIALGLLACSPLGAAAQDGYGCEDLWVQRNGIYKDAGYCFKTQRAIREFGNAGCRYDRQEDVPLSERQRAEVNRIIRQEQRMRCPR